MDKESFWISLLLLPLLFVVFAFVLLSFEYPYSIIGLILNGGFVVLFLFLYFYNEYKTLKDENLSKSILILFIIMVVNLVAGFIFSIAGHGLVSSLSGLWGDSDWGGDMSGLLTLFFPILLASFVFLSGVVVVIVKIFKKSK